MNGYLIAIIVLFQVFCMFVAFRNKKLQNISESAIITTMLILILVVCPLVYVGISMWQLSRGCPVCEGFGHEEMKNEKQTKR